MDSLHQRLLKSFEYLRDNGVLHTQVQFAEAIGKSQAQMSLAFKDAPKRCTLGLMKAIADTFPDVLSRDYLLTGEGEVAAPDRTMRPHFEAKARAGFMDGVAQAETGTLRPRIPGVRDYDFTIGVDGMSMFPKIEPGDLLLCRKVTDRANPPIGKICVIDSKDGAVVKVVAGADEESIRLHSLNPNYRDYTVELASVGGIAEVVGSVRIF